MPGSSTLCSRPIRFPYSKQVNRAKRISRPLYYVVASLAVLPANLADNTGAFRLNPQFIWAGMGGSKADARQAQLFGIGLLGLALAAVCSPGGGSCATSNSTAIH